MKTLSQQMLDLITEHGAPACATALYDACHESLVAALQLVKQGLETGNVRAKPIIEMDFEAESAPIRTLDEIVDAALKLAGAA